MAESNATHEPLFNVEKLARLREQAESAHAAARSYGDRIREIKSEIREVQSDARARFVGQPAPEGHALRVQELEARIERIKPDADRASARAQQLAGLVARCRSFLEERGVRDFDSAVPVAAWRPSDPPGTKTATASDRATLVP